MVDSSTRSCHRTHDFEVVDILRSAVIADESCVLSGGISHNLEVPDGIVLAVELATMLAGIVSHRCPRAILEVDVGCESGIYRGISIVYHTSKPEEFASIVYLVIAFIVFLGWLEWC